VLWVYLANDKEKWWAFVNMVMDFHDFTKCRKPLEHQSDYWFLKNKSFWSLLNFIT
jgi:hypothetical protein